MPSQGYQIVGSYLDILLFLALGLSMLLGPRIVVKESMAEEEKRKIRKVLKICGTILIVIACVKLLLKLT